MASEVNIIISVKDLATAEINKIKKSLKSLNSATKENADETSKNERKSADETEKAEKKKQTALGNSEKAFKSLGNSMKFLYAGSLSGGILGSVASIGAFKFAEMGAQSDELRISFEKTFGRGAGSLLDNVRTSVKGIVDDTTLMRNAIQANIAGIKDVSLLPQLFKMGAVASQRLGIDASEGIELARKAVVEFNEGAMEQLGIINKLDPAYKTQLAIIEKTTKGLGAYMSIAQKVAYVQDQMAKRFGNTEVIMDNMQAFKYLTSSLINFRNNLMYIVGDALAPFLRNIAEVTTELVKFMHQIRETGPFKEGALTIIRFTVALGGMLTVLTGVKLAMMAISLVFSGPFGLIGGFLALMAALKLSKISSEGFLDSLHKVGQMAQGVFQLLSSFDPNTGLAKISKDLADSLGHDTLQNVIDIAINIEKIMLFTKGFGEGLQLVADKVLQVAKYFGFASTSLEGMEGSGKIFGIMAGALIVLISPLILVASLFSGIASSIARIGKLTGVLRSVGGITTGLGEAGGAATVGGAATAEAGGQLSLFGAAGLGESGLTAAAGTAAGVGLGSAIATTAGAAAIPYGVGALLREKYFPNAPVASTIPDPGYAGSAFDRIGTALGQMVRYLESIDSKTTKKNLFEHKVMGTK